MNNIKQIATQILCENGLPTTKNEKWHYTNLKVLLPNCNVIQYNTDEWKISNIDGIESSHTKEITVPSCVEEYFANNTIAQLNAIGYSGGHKLVLKANETYLDIIELTNNIATDQKHTSIDIDVPTDSSATIVEKHDVKSAETEGSLATCINKISLDKNSNINYIIIRDHSSSLPELQQINASISENANLNLYIVNINCAAKVRRQEIKVTLCGSYANFNLRSINLLNGNSHADITMVVKHKAPNATSSELLRNIVCDNAVGVFAGLIKVDNIAQKTDAKMGCKSLLLSDEASFFAKPELEIFADDVLCGHGATIAQIEDDSLFYLESRGIDKAYAKALLVKSFVKELLEENPLVTDILSLTIDNWVETHASN